MPHRLPDVVVEIIHAHLRVGADAIAGKAGGVSADATVVCILAPALRRRLRHGLAVVRVPAACTDGETLQQVALAACIALREPLVPFQLVAGRGEDLSRHDGGDGDVNPLFRRLVAEAGLAPARGSIPAADRAQWATSLRHLGFAIGGLAAVRRVAKDLPDGGPLPASCAPAGRDTVRIERPHDLAERLLLVHQGVVDPAHDLGLGQQYVVPRRLGLRLANVAVAVRRARQRVDCALSRPVQLAAPTAFGDLGALILGDHALDLHQQRVLRTVRRRALEEDDGNTARRKLLQQQHLVRVASCESIGVVYVHDVDRALRDPIPQPFQRGANQRRPTEAVVHVEIPGQHMVPVCKGSLAQRVDLAPDGDLLDLLLGGYARVQGDGLHAALPSLRGRVRPRCGWSRPAASARTSRCTTGITSSYARRRWSADRRAGSKTVLMYSRRRMQRGRSTQETGILMLTSRQRAPLRSALLPPSVDGPLAKRRASYPALPGEVFPCVAGTTMALCSSVGMTLRPEHAACRSETRWECEGEAMVGGDGVMAEGDGDPTVGGASVRVSRVTAT
jgi:hypothetical protein